MELMGIEEQKISNKWGMAIQELMGFHRGFHDDFTGNSPVFGCSLRPGNHGPTEKIRHGPRFAELQNR